MFYELLPTEQGQFENCTVNGSAIKAFTPSPQPRGRRNFGRLGKGIFSPL